MHFCAVRVSYSQTISRGLTFLIPIMLPGRGVTFFGIQVKNRVYDSYSRCPKHRTIHSFSKAAKAESEPRYAVHRTDYGLKTQRAR